MILLESNFDRSKDPNNIFAREQYKNINQLVTKASAWIHKGEIRFIHLNYHI